MQPRLTDNDKGEIAVTLDGKEIRGWSYKDDDERRIKMLAAREYVEGWGDGYEMEAQDWENACHELIWEKGQVDLFLAIQRRAIDLSVERVKSTNSKTP